MRLVCAALLALLCGHAPVMAAPAVTLVLQFDEGYSTQSLDVMKREVASIVGESGIRVDWRFLSDVHSSDSFDSLVVVLFRGACMMRRPAYLLDERGYYASPTSPMATCCPSVKWSATRLPTPSGRRCRARNGTIAIPFSAGRWAACWPTNCSTCSRNRSITRAMA